MSTPEINISNEQSLGKPGGQRVILLLRRLGDKVEPLSVEGVSHLATTLHKDKAKFERAAIAVTNIGKYVLDFTLPHMGEEEAVAEAAIETDAALLQNMVPAEVEEVWLVPPGKPELRWLTDEDYGKMPKVTSSAIEALERHRHETLEHDFDLLLFNVA